MNYINKQGGLIKMVVLFIVLVSIFLYMDIDLVQQYHSEPIQTIIAPLKSLWNNVIIDFLYEGVKGYFTDVEQEIERGGGIEQIVASSTASI